MSKIMILVPCMDLIHAKFAESLLLLDHAGHDVTYGFKRGSLIYDSRNQLLDIARNSDADKILWFDSDMDIPMQTLRMLSDDLDEGRDIVSGLYFKRKQPVQPVIYKECFLGKVPGGLAPTAKIYEEYPKDEVFEIEAMGFGCVMMTMSAANKIVDQYGLMPFMPVAGFGEDLSFCMRASGAGIKMWCDSRVRLGHIGTYTYTEVSDGTA